MGQEEAPDGWTLHWLEASGSLAEFRSDLIRDFRNAHQTVSRLMPPPRLDVLIQRLTGETIPEMGIVGRAYRGTLFAMTVDPDNANFSQSLHNGALHRQIVHEVHHCMRMAGPGYGWTLGEALISEGLAGQFVRNLLGNEPEPWECAVTPQALRALVDTKAFGSTNYDHRAWFYGSGPHPRWLGYTLGYQIVGHWLAKTGKIDASTWVNVPAQTIITAALEDGFLSQDS